LIQVLRCDSTKYKPTLKGRKIGVLLAEGFDAKTKNALVAAIKKEGATPAIIAPKVGGVRDSAGTKHAAEMALRGSPSVLFDAESVLAGPAGVKSLSADPDGIASLIGACRHLKAIGISGASQLAQQAQVVDLTGVVNLAAARDIGIFLDAARKGKIWDREPA
jgi:catalase